MGPWGTSQRVSTVEVIAQVVEALAQAGPIEIVLLGHCRHVEGAGEPTGTDSTSNAP
jgi:hypothetical protein